MYLGNVGDKPAITHQLTDERYCIDHHGRVGPAFYQQLAQYRRVAIEVDDKNWVRPPVGTDILIFKTTCHSFDQNKIPRLRALASNIEIDTYDDQIV
jgi:hypothetical protein